MTGIALPLRATSLPRAPHAADRYVLPLAVTLLVHALVLLPLLPAFDAASRPAASQPVMVGIVVASPTPPAPVQTTSTPPPVPQAPAPRPVKQTPVTPARNTPNKAAPQTALESAQPAAAPSAAASAAPAPATTTTRATAEAESSEIEPPHYQAAYLSNPQPPYPPMSRKLREQGNLRLHVMVNAAGEAEAIRIKSSSGFERLDQAALAAVQKWRFVPARRQGQAVAGWVEVPIQFHLEN
jgi:protein TonB